MASERALLDLKIRILGNWKTEKSENSKIRQNSSKIGGVEKSRKKLKKVEKAENPEIWGRMESEMGSRRAEKGAF